MMVYRLYGLCVFLCISMMISHSISSCNLIRFPSCCSCDGGNTCDGKINGLTSDDIDTIHTVYMTHLDVGYTIGAGSPPAPGPFREVCNYYAKEFYPACASNAASGQSSYDYGVTNYPWMILEVLNTTNCATYPLGSPANWTQYQNTLIEAIENDSVIWNANSVLSYWDATSGHIFNHSLTSCNVLNKRFGKRYGTVFKNTDISGLSVSIVPYLNKSNISAIHMGYGTNEGGRFHPPDFGPQAQLRQLFETTTNPYFDAQPNLFIWEHEETDTSIIVMVEYDYGEFILPNNSTEALVFLFTRENQPPVETAAAQSYLDCLADTFNATIFGTSLDEYVENVLLKPSVYNNIARIAGSKNIGDLWVHGIQSDPFKLGTFKEADRVLLAAINNNTLSVSANDAEYEWYMRKLQKMPEHNGGLGSGGGSGWSGTICSSYPSITSEITDYSGTAAWLSEWEAQRNFNYPPLSSNGIPIDISGEWANIFEQLSNTFNTTFKPNENDIMNEFNNYNNNNIKYNNKYAQTCGNWQFVLSPNGDFTYLYNTMTCQTYATNDYKFGTLLYNSYDNSQGIPEGVYEYPNRCPNSWSTCRYTASYNMTNYAYNATNEGNCTIMLQFTRNVVSNSDTPDLYYELGAPNTTIIQLNMYPDVFQYEIYWFGKPLSCIIQAFSLQFNLPFESQAYALINSIGYDIDPSNSFNNTVSRFHGVDDGLTIYNTSFDSIRIEMIDSSLVVFGELNKLITTNPHYTMTQPENYSLINVIFYANWWGGSFEQYYDLDLITRVNVYFNQTNNYCPSTSTADDAYEFELATCAWVIIAISCLSV